MKADAISIVEAAYDCGSDSRSWLGGLLEHAAPRLDRGFGMAVAMYEPGIAPDQMPLAGRAMDEKLYSAFMAMCLAHPDVFHRLNMTSPPIGTVTKNMKMTADDARAWPPFTQYMHPFGVKDVTGVFARDPSGAAIFINVPMPDLRNPTRSEVASWSQIAAHISAGARLRRALPSLTSDDLASGAEAVLSPSGSIAHAEVGAQSMNARESLRRAAKAIDRARSKARSNEDEALGLWQGLVAGRWSLIDRFDSDGRRFLVARKNEPEVMDPRALTLRERQVLAYAGMGHPLKLIAYSLGVSISSVSTCRKAAMRKLGLRTHADVVRLFAPAPPTAGPDNR